MSILRNLIVLSFLVNSLTLTAQNIWQKIDLKTSQLNSKNNIADNAQSSTFELDLKAFKALASNAPLRFSEESKNQAIFLDFPNPDGNLASYQIVEAPTLSPELGAKYPEIKSYAGYNTLNPADYLRFDISPRGLHAMILSSEGSTVIINPLNNNNTDIYQVFYKKDAVGTLNFTCGTEAPSKQITEDIQSQNESNLLSTDFKTYRLALACTGEYGIFHGNDTTLVLAAMNTTMTRVNGVYEREFALTMEIIPENDQIIYLVPGSDPYSNNNGGAMLGQNQSTINAAIGSSNYDIGHVFSTGGGGIAFLASVCTSNKARGVTGGGSPVGDPFDIDYVAHEMGHQFGANHTQNNSCNRVNSAAFEPGSASTIMGYAGICNPNVQNNSDDHFHIHSIYEINAHLNGTGGCAAVEVVDNTAPTIEPLEDYVIPHSTPFVLTAIASSNENDSLTYCWEQYDNEIAQMPPLSTNTNGPAFRSNSPTNDNKRYLPRLENVVNNTNNTWEVLSSVARDYKFKVTVRDNFPLAGRISDDELDIEVDGVAGPFLVTEPNTALDWPALSLQTITWDIAGTDLAPVNCSHVDIYLSVDGGYTYPITIAENVPNQGYHYGQIPNNQTSTARIMVKGHNNIFYDISNTDFTISQPQEGFSVWLEHPSVIGCAGQDFSFYFTSVGFDGFDESIEFDLTDQSDVLPFSFETNPLTPGEENYLYVTAPVYPDNEVELWSGEVNTVSGQYEFTMPVSAVIYPNTVDNIELFFPSNEAEDINPELVFEWVPVANATSYSIEIALDPDFDNIVITESDITSTTYSVQEALENETNYYWRVTPSNPCALGETSSVYSFLTNSIVCVSLEPEDLPVNIPASSVSTVSSKLDVLNSGIITDINVTGIEIEHSWINDLQIDLVSPSGTTVRLLDNTCDSEDDILLSFDDEAANEYGDWPCPPIEGLVYTPFESLSAFNDESSEGEWSLEVSDVFAQDGGFLTNWNLDICYLGDLPISVVSNTIEPSCYDSSDGAITIIPEFPDAEYTYEWENGNTSNTLIGVPAGTYTLTITDGSQVLTQTIELDAPDQISIFENITPDLDNQSTGSIDLNISGGVNPFEALWNTGASELILDSITVGTYSVTITDANDCQEIFEFEVENLTSPIALFESDLLEGCAPFEVQFTNLTNGDYDNLSWTFEGGSPNNSAVENPSVTYNQAGSYFVRLIASNTLTADTIIQENYIEVSEVPTTAFDIINTGNYIFSFENNTTNADSYFWDFGNGSTSTEENPSIEFEFPGSYNILLVADSPCGSDSLYQELLTTSSSSIPDQYNFEVIPNPSTGVFSLSWTSNEKLDAFNWEFINTLGQVLDQGSINTEGNSGMESFQKTEIPSGLYYLKIRINEGIKVFRIIKE
jgi:PKD repeat protein/subtilisin-like proprotein convertase family protein